MVWPKLKTINHKPMPHYRAVWISDLHLGTRGCNSQAILNFLSSVSFDTLYIVGDLIDIWALRRRIYWPQSHNQVIEQILHKSSRGSRVVYIPGNHDKLMRHFYGRYGNLLIAPHAIHYLRDGRRLLVLHGDELDSILINAKWFAFIGDLGYRFLVEIIDPVVHVYRKLRKRRRWSFSAYFKHKLKNAISFMDAFEKAMVRYARDRHVSAVICGHIHNPAVRTIHGIEYYNCGDFVENSSAIVEHADGRLELLTDLPGEEPEVIANNTTLPVNSPVQHVPLSPAPEIKSTQSPRASAA